jgi:hypothetical protein
MTTKAIIEELAFTTCTKWNTPECPNDHTAAMGLATINWPHLFLLNDDTVRELEERCAGCSGKMF